MSVEADVRDSETVKAMVEQVTDKWSKIDILVNNAGINRDTLLLRMSDDAWDDVIKHQFAWSLPVHQVCPKVYDEAGVGTHY